MLKVRPLLLQHHHHGIRGRAVACLVCCDDAVRDESDLQRHIDYIHFNPVKHGLVKKVEDWPYSSYHRYVASGRYAKEYFTKLQEDYEDVFAGE